MVGWHHRLNEHEFEQSPGDGGGQRRLVCCSPRGRKSLTGLSNTTTTTTTKKDAKILNKMPANQIQQFTW